ncbi:MAG: energy transducer TonB [Stenotrophomonas sp.]
MKLRRSLLLLPIPLLLAACQGDQAADTPAPLAPTPVAAISTPPPAYPADVACTGGEGTSVLKVSIGPAGVPDNITVLTSSGFPALDQAAQAAVEGWRFRAATRNGQPVAASIQVPVTFRLPAELPSDCYLVQERLRQGG